MLGLDDWPRVLGKLVSEPQAARRGPCGRGPAGRAAASAPIVLEGGERGRPRRAVPAPGCAARCARCWPRSTTACSRCASTHGGPSARPTCTKAARRVAAGRPPTAFPARYLMACQNGHLDDFQSVRFLHGGVPCRGTLRLVEFGAGGGPGDVQVSCDGCRRRRRLSQAFGDDAAPYTAATLPGQASTPRRQRRLLDRQPETLILGAATRGSRSRARRCRSRRRPASSGRRSTRPGRFSKGCPPAATSSTTR